VAVVSGKDEVIKDLQAEVRRLADKNAALRLEGQMKGDDRQFRISSTNVLKYMHSEDSSSLKPHTSKYGVFTIKLSRLPTFDGEYNAEKMITFIGGLERTFNLRATETGISGSTTNWGDYVIQWLTGEAAKWAQLMWLATERV